MKQKKRENKYYELIQYLSNDKGSVVFLFAMVLASIAINLTLPKLVESYINNLQGKYDTTLLINIALSYIVLIVIRIVLSVLSNFFGNKIGLRVSNRLRIRAIDHVFNLDIEFHKKHPSGELIERIDGDISYLTTFFSVVVVYFIGNILLVLGVIVLFYVENIILGFIFTVVSISIFVMFALFQKKTSTLWGHSREADASLSGYLSEHIAGMDDIRGVGEEEYTINQLNERLDYYKKTYSKAAFVSNIPTTYFYSILNVSEAIGMAIAVFLFSNSQINLGSVYIIINYLSLLSIPFMALRNQFTNLQLISAAYDRVLKLFEYIPTIPYGSTVLSNSAGLAVKVNNLCFSYDTNEVLNNISFDIKQGEVVGIVGKSGSGKSTLIQLMAKVYSYNQGSITYDSLDIREIDKQSFYDHVHLLHQKSDIINASLRDNITLYTKELPDTEIIDILTKCGLKNWFEQLPDGLDTIIGRESLSVGESQLLSLTRVFVVQPKLFLLDEITSFIDEKTEKSIFSTLELILKGRTVIIIAHTFQTLNLVNKVMIMRNGNITKFASRDEISDKLIEENLDK